MPSKEFQNKICKATEKRKTTLVGGYLSADFYRYIKEEIDIDTVLLQNIIGDLNQGIGECLLKGKKVRLPHIGDLELRKFARNITTVNGEVKTNLPINWKATLDLWEKDPKAYEERFLIKLNVPYIYRVYYIHSLSRFKNLPYIKFKLNRGLKRALTSKIQNKEIDAFLLK